MEHITPLMSKVTVFATDQEMLRAIPLALGAFYIAR